MKTIDLSLPLADHMPRYPSPYLPDVEVRPAATHAEHGRSAQILKFGTHVSTHIDAPFHAIPKGWTIDQIPTDYFVGVARIVRFSDRNASTPLTRQDLEKFEGLELVQKLVLDTGWGKKTWGQKEYFTEGPYLTRDASEFLASLPNLHLLGMDFPNIDSKKDMVMGKPNPNHQILLGRNIILLENIMRLDEVDDEFFLSALPLKLVGGDGCPCRAVAIFPLTDVAGHLKSTAKSRQT